MAITVNNYMTETPFIEIPIEGLKYGKLIIKDGKSSTHWSDYTPLNQLDPYQGTIYKAELYNIPNNNDLNHWLSNITELSVYNGFSPLVRMNVNIFSFSKLKRLNIDIDYFGRGEVISINFLQFSFKVFLKFQEVFFLISRLMCD